MGYVPNYVPNGRHTRLGMSLFSICNMPQVQGMHVYCGGSSPDCGGVDYFSVDGSLFIMTLNPHSIPRDF